MPSPTYPDYPFNRDYPGAGTATPLPVTPVRPAARAAKPAPRGSAVAASTEPVAFPVELPAGSDDGIILDFGVETVGKLVIAADAPSGTRLEVTCGEYYDEARLAYPSPLTWYKDQHDTFTLTGGAVTLSSPARRTFRYVRLKAAGGQPVRITDICCNTVGYPVTAPGPFTCSDDRLNRIVEICDRTTRLCMQAFYEDGLKRDGFLWIGDYRIQYLCNALLYGDAALARKSLCMIAASQRADGALPGNAAWGGGGQHPYNVDTIPVLRSDRPQTWIIVNYCSDFLCAVEEYVLYTGDASIREDLRPCLLRLFAYLCDRVPAPHLVPPQSMQEDSYITDNSHAASSVGFFSPAWLTATLAEGFRHGASLAGALHEKKWQERCRTRYRQLHEYFRNSYVTPNRIMDYPVDNGKTEAFSWHAPAAAVSAGFMDPGAIRNYTRRLEDDNRTLRPAAGMALFHVMRGLGDAGQVQLMTDWIRTEYGRVLDAGLTTTPEFIPADIRDLFHHEDKSGSGWQNDQRMASMCHGWTAGPAYLLPRYIFGIAPTRPGYSEISLDPHPAGQENVSAVIATPHGPVRMEARREEKVTVFDYHLPPGITATVIGEGRVATPSGPGTVRIVRPQPACNV